MEKTTNTQTEKRTRRRRPMALLRHMLPINDNGKTRMMPHLHPAQKAHKLWRRKTQRYKVNDMSGRKQS